jgi:hypothetical protein
MFVRDRRPTDDFASNLKQNTLFTTTIRINDGVGIAINSHPPPLSRIAQKEERVEGGE